MGTRDRFWIALCVALAAGVVWLQAHAPVECRHETGICARGWDY